MGLFEGRECMFNRRGELGQISCFIIPCSLPFLKLRGLDLVTHKVPLVQSEKLVFGNLPELVTLTCFDIFLHPCRDMGNGWGSGHAPTHDLSDELTEGCP